MNRIEKALVITIACIFVILAAVTYLVRPDIFLLVLGMEGVLVFFLAALFTILRNAR